MDDVGGIRGVGCPHENVRSAPSKPSAHGVNALFHRLSMVALLSELRVASQRIHFCFAITLSLILA
jgi:hypothetical protein